MQPPTLRSLSIFAKAASLMQRSTSFSGFVQRTRYRDSFSRIVTPEKLLLAFAPTTVMSAFCKNIVSTSSWICLKLVTFSTKSRLHTLYMVYVILSTNSLPFRLKLLHNNYFFSIRRYFSNLTWYYFTV